MLYLLFFLKFLEKYRTDFFKNKTKQKNHKRYEPLKKPNDYKEEDGRKKKKN